MWSGVAVRAQWGVRLTSVVIARDLPIVNAAPECKENGKTPRIIWGRLVIHDTLFLLRNQYKGKQVHVNNFL